MAASRKRRISACTAAVGTGTDPDVARVDRERRRRRRHTPPLHHAARDLHQFPVARDQHVEVVAGARERHRAAPDGQRVRDPQRAEIDPHQPRAGGVGDPGGVTGERDVDRRAADAHLPAELALGGVDDRERARRRVDGDHAARVGGERDRAFAGVDPALLAVRLERVDAPVGRAGDPHGAGPERDVARVGTRAERIEGGRPGDRGAGRRGRRDLHADDAPVAASVTHRPLAPAAIRPGAPPTHGRADVAVGVDRRDRPWRGAVNHTCPSRTASPAGGATRTASGAASRPEHEQRRADGGQQRGQHAEAPA